MKKAAYWAGFVERLKRECFNTCVMTPFNCETVTLELKKNDQRDYKST